LMVGGYVKVNGQVIGIFRKGMRLAERNGQWKLVGNGSTIPTGIWKAGTLVTMVAPPDNLTVYQHLLPAGMSLPQNPLVRVVAADWTSIANGWRPYRLVAVYIQVVFNGRLGWYTVTMPENDWLPVMAGIAVGLPKYVADITWIGDAPGWHSEVSVAGDSRIAMTFSPAASVPVAAADVPSFQLSPFDSNIVIETSFSVYGSLGTVTPGLATISFPTGAPWFGLLNQGSAKTAYFANAPNFQMDMISEPH
ncbi:MAG TPA: acetoacetate decarboxylase family protein, partial [Geothrix sp.]